MLLGGAAAGWPLAARAQQVRNFPSTGSSKLRRLSPARALWHAALRLRQAAAEIKPTHLALSSIRNFPSAGRSKLRACRAGREASGSAPGYGHKPRRGCLRAHRAAGRRGGPAWTAFSRGAEADAPCDADDPAQRAPGYACVRTLRRPVWCGRRSPMPAWEVHMLAAWTVRLINYFVPTTTFDFIQRMAPRTWLSRAFETSRRREVLSFVRAAEKAARHRARDGEWHHRRQLLSPARALRHAVLRLRQAAA
jgi:hypothetical protein